MLPVWEIVIFMSVWDCKGFLSYENEKSPWKSRTFSGGEGEIWRAPAPTRVVCRELSPAFTRLCSLALWLLRFTKTILNRFCLLALAGKPPRKSSNARIFSNTKGISLCDIPCVLAEKERFELLSKLAFTRVWSGFDIILTAGFWFLPSWFVIYSILSLSILVISFIRVALSSV